MKEMIVTKEVLDIYDRYDGDLGLLHERWADEADLEKVNSEQCEVLGEYIEKLEFIRLEPGLYSVQLREAAAKRIGELEERIDDEVVAILRKRLLGD